MEQQIGFCTASDGVRIAYATLGEGPPLVYATGWPIHLELEWEKPFARAFLTELAEGRTLIRYDMRGTGLSDRDVSDLSLAALMRDLDSVVDHLALDQFDLVSLGVLGGPIAITYAARHPERVRRLIVSSGFVEGAKLTSPDRQRALIEYVDQFGFPLLGFFDPTAPLLDAHRGAVEIQSAGATPRVQSALLRTLYAVDVSEQLDKLTMPTLVMHGRSDNAVRFAQGRELASRLRHARFVAFEGNSGAPWSVSHVIIPELHKFLGIEVKVREVPSTSPQGLVTILFTDIEGSTALSQQLGDAKAQDVRRAHNTIVREALRAHAGTEIKHTGDGIMASFGSASAALECAMAIERAVGAHGDANLRVHVGLNAGEPIAEEQDLFGTAVDLARRICDQAKGGEILASDVLRQLVAGKGFLFADRGETALRGFEDPVRIYEVAWQE